MIDENVLTVDEVAEYLKVSSQTVRKLIKCGKIPSFRVGNVYRVMMDDLIVNLKQLDQER